MKSFQQSFHQSEFKKMILPGCVKTQKLKKLCRLKTLKEKGKRLEYLLNFV